MKLMGVHYWNSMSGLCNASLPEELIKVKEEEQPGGARAAVRIWNNLQNPWRNELGQSKGLSPSVLFQHCWKFAFSLWSKATRCVLVPSQTSNWKGPVLSFNGILSLSVCSWFAEQDIYRLPQAKQRGGVLWVPSLHSRVVAISE